MEKRIFDVIANIMEESIENINLDSSSDNIDNWDSLKHMNLVLALEEEFEVQFESEEIMEMLNVGLIFEILKEKTLSQN